MNVAISDVIKSGKVIGFVPTMGALHEGHLQLIDRSVRENDISIVSIFVNPLQFNNPIDFQKYPVDLNSDLEKLKARNCDIVFTPDAAEFYSKKPMISIDFGILGTVLEGHYRPGHFNGVAIVVSRLLHLMEADKAYFGLKDLQQYYIVSRLCHDLGIKTNIIPCDIVRENDGLAMSSRNRRLSDEDRSLAPEIYKLLKVLKEKTLELKDFNVTKSLIKPETFLNGKIAIEYLEMISLPEFELTSKILSDKSYAICTAVELSGIRLIDNVIFETETM